jgi:hypothetical protein
VANRVLDHSWRVQVAVAVMVAVMVAVTVIVAVAVMVVVARHYALVAVAVVVKVVVPLLSVAQAGTLPSVWEFPALHQAILSDSGQAVSVILRRW